MNVPRSPLLVALLLLLAGCTGPAANVEPGDSLSDHTRCDFKDREGKAIDCTKAAHVLDVVPTLPEAIWLCTEFEKTGGRESTDPNLFGIFYDPQGKRNALWFNLTWEGRHEPPGVWEAAFYTTGGRYYSFSSKTPTGFVVLPDTLPDGEMHLYFARVNVTLGGLVAGGDHRMLWVREPLAPEWTSIDGTTFGVVHAVAVNGSDFFFYGRTGFGSTGDKLWQGQDYSLNVWWSQHSMGVRDLHPTSLPPDGKIGFANTPYGDFSVCTR